MAKGKSINSEEQRRENRDKMREWRAKNRHKCLERERKEYQKRKAYYANYYLKANYGITDPQWYEKKLAEQGGVCAICKTLPGKERLCLDHDHSTGELRELLCWFCNLALGNLFDDIKLAQAMIAYLEKHKALPKERVRKQGKPLKTGRKSVEAVSLFDCIPLS